MIKLCSYSFDEGRDFITHFSDKSLSKEPKCQTHQLSSDVTMLLCECTVKEVYEGWHVNDQMWAVMDLESNKPANVTAPAESENRRHPGSRQSSPGRTDPVRYHHKRYHFCECACVEHVYALWSTWMHNILQIHYFFCLLFKGITQ